MLANFAAKQGRPLPEGDAGWERRVYEGREVLMGTYEQEMRQPIKNMLLGDLPQALLIQVITYLTYL
jgi:hypothetical protein